MTWDRKLYPDNWEEIALKVKTEAKWICEECGRPCRKPGEKIQDHYERIKAENKLDWIRDYWSQWVEQGSEKKPNKPTRFVLTVAHMDHRPENCDRTNLKTLCAPCHCRYDTTPEARAIKKKLKAERTGQLNLLELAQ